MLDKATVKINCPAANHIRHIRSASGNCNRAFKAILIALVGVCVLEVGCKDVSTVWNTEVRSPDGHWVARAMTEQHGGPGTAGIVTAVYLKQTDASSPPQEVLAFFL